MSQRYIDTWNKEEAYLQCTNQYSHLELNLSQVRIKLIPGKGGNVILMKNNHPTGFNIRVSFISHRLEPSFRLRFLILTNDDNAHEYQRVRFEPQSSEPTHALSPLWYGPNDFNESIQCSLFYL